VSAIPPGAAPRGAAAAAVGQAGKALAGNAISTAAKPAAAPKPPTAVPFPPAELKAAVDELLARYPTKQAALIPVLHLAQGHHGGWISPEVEAGVARFLDLSDAHVRGVLTFYAMFHTQPVGRHDVWVCRTLTCWLRGAPELTKAALAKAGIAKVGGTDAEKRFTVREMECLGLCEKAPAAWIDGQVHAPVTPESLTRLMDGCR
jgi:NADH-quinone oxidoreductase subunit E